jgi:hypothetical protein
VVPTELPRLDQCQKRERCVHPIRTFWLLTRDAFTAVFGVHDKAHPSNQYVPRKGATKQHGVRGLRELQSPDSRVRRGKSSCAYSREYAGESPSFGGRKGSIFQRSALLRHAPEFARAKRGLSGQWPSEFSAGEVAGVPAVGASAGAAAPAGTVISGAGAAASCASSEGGTAAMS